MTATAPFQQVFMMDVPPPPVVASGFTTVVPVAPTQPPTGSGSGSRLIYVSSSTGSDIVGVGDGTITAPFRTAVHGASFIRTGFSDQLFFMCGDTWTDDNINDNSRGLFLQSGVAPTITSGDYITGPTMSGPILIGSYGNGARPIFRYSIGDSIQGRGGSFITSQQPTNGMNIVIQGLNIYAYTRDPANPSYVGAAAAAADFTTHPIRYANGGGVSGTDVYVGLLMIEDCVINYFVTNIVCQGTTTGTSPNEEAILMPDFSLVLRRNIITNAYNGNGHSQGLGGTAGLGTFYDVENFWDHNGWCENAGLIAQTPGTGATVFNRNIYDGNQGITQQGAVVRVSYGSINARGSSGSQWRSGCNVTNGLFFRNFIRGFDVGENQGTDTQSANINNNTAWASTIQNCVVLESVPMPASNASAAAPAGSGIVLSNIQNVTINNNIIAHCDTTFTDSHGIEWADTDVSGSPDTVAGNAVTNLITFRINTAYTNTTQPTNVNVASATNYVDLTGSNSGSAPEPFPHPNPTSSSLVGDYYLSVGGTNNYLDFLSACAARARGTWNTSLTAAAVNTYIRAGFGR